jgi:hypothetical protein
MELRKEYAAPCGLYCGVCGIRMAHENNDDNFKERLAPVYGLTAADIRCGGCLSDEPFVMCQMCNIKTCTREKGYEVVTSVQIFPASTLTNSRLPWVSGSSCGRFPPGGN